MTQPVYPPPPTMSGNTSTTYASPLPAQVNTPQTTRGLCRITHPDAGDFTFRTNPNEISWSYFLNTKVENTYGGRVVQILSTKIDDLIVKVECGRGGWPYLWNVCRYFRDLLVQQRKGSPATFEYTTRQWRMDVWALSIPFQDEVTATTREITLQFKVQEDISGVMSGQTLGQALSSLQDGVGFQVGPYNSSQENTTSTGGLGGLGNEAASLIAGLEQTIAASFANISIPSLGGGIPGISGIPGIGGGLGGLTSLIPGLSSIGGLGGIGSLPGLGSIPGIGSIL